VVRVATYGHPTRPPAARSVMMGTLYPPVRHPARQPPERSPMTDMTWPDVLGRITQRDNLGEDEVRWAMGQILAGEAADSQIAAFAVGLRMKGETVAEMTAIIDAMLDFSERVDVDGIVVDTCGTGGDRSGSINVSTMSALVVAGAGVRVAKHGNRAASSACGSADLLEHLGVAIDISPEEVARCIRDASIGFCFAPRFHPAMRHAGPVRRALGVPTLFNFLGPLANPAGVRRQALGVSDAAMAMRMAGVLERRGAERALVFYGHDGLDELTTTTESTVVELRDGELHTFELDPVELGFALVPPEALKGGDAACNGEIARRVLAGEPGPARDITLLNAAAALVVADAAPSLAEGVELAAASVDEGRAAAALARLVAVSNASSDGEAA
jgi:anthranilate phosphoribosyltransferase